MQPKGTPLACATPLRNFSINSVASTYSEFVVVFISIFSFCIFKIRLSAATDSIEAQMLMLPMLIYVSEGPGQH